MHIPDGYLSPSTCASLYGAAAPFWYVALKRTKAALQTRTVPLVSIFGAFSFVIMMFNLPLPGGTTGHAVGVAIAAIVLGPAASILAISMALLVQALFFGDGGITAFGANCFNMAIVGSLVSFAVYSLVAWQSEIGSVRRVVAAGLAGYLALNAAALCAAIEFGIQPLLFADRSGTPLYAPYPLRVAVPAMMIGHLTIAGLAELVVSAGLVSYLQRTNPQLLQPAAQESTTVASRRALWVVLGCLLVLTPLGIIAVGSAWGEWSLEDFTNEAARKEISAVSGNHPLPGQSPPGMQRLRALWKAPLPEYAPSFIPNAQVSYLFSALIGVAVLLLLGAVMTRYLAKKRRRRNFIERTIQDLITALQESLFAEDTAQATGRLQSIDARVKLAGFIALIVAAVASRRLSVLVFILALSLLAASASRIAIPVLLRRVWMPVFAFTGVIALPSLVLVPGISLLQIPVLSWTITWQGARSASFLVLRAETSATLAFLLIVTTRWNTLLRSLRFFRVPAAAVMVATVTYRYLFVLLQTAQNTFESRQTRMVGKLEPALQRQFVAAGAGALLERSLQLSSDVNLAMQARGFRGESRLLDDQKMQRRDWCLLAVFLMVAALAFVLGR